MTEEVETGGTKRFVYDKNYQPRLNEQKKREIEEAYRIAEERKRRERRTRNYVIAAIIILLIILGIFIFS